MSSKDLGRNVSDDNFFLLFLYWLYILYCIMLILGVDTFYSIIGLLYTSVVTGKPIGV